MAYCIQLALQWTRAWDFLGYPLAVSLCPVSPSLPPFFTRFQSWVVGYLPQTISHLSLSLWRGSNFTCASPTLDWVSEPGSGSETTSN